MEVKKIDPTSKVNTETEQPILKNPSLGENSFEDTLYSLTTTVGWGLWEATSFIIRRSFNFIYSLIFKEEAEIKPILLTDLDSPKKFKEKFESDPFSVIIKLIDSIHEYPTEIEKIMKMIASDLKLNYKYPMEMEKRKALILSIDEIVMQCILSPKQRIIDEQVLMHTMDGDEANAISVNDADWPDIQSKYSQKAQDFRSEYKKIENCKREFAVLWETLFIQLNEDLPYLDLFSDLKILNPIYKDNKTPGLFLERLLYKMDESPNTLYKLTNFLKRSFFDGWADYTIARLDFTASEKASPQLKLFCKRLRILLADKEKRDQLFNVTTEVIKIFRPLKSE